MKYEEFKNRKTFTREELLARSWGTLIEDPPPDLGVMPAPPMLIIDRVIDIEHRGSQGKIIAEQCVHFDDWFFECHFRNNPIMPCGLILEAVWQLVGFYCFVRGAQGSGRALGAKETQVFGHIRPHNSLVRYELNVRRYVELKETEASICVGTAKVLADEAHVCTVHDAKLGFFKNITYPDYPNISKNSTGGVMRR